MIYQIVYALLCVLFAWYNAKRIKEEKAINHPVNGVVHFFLWAIIALFAGWWILLVLPFIGRLFFDTALNLMRGLDFDYVSEWVKAGDSRSSQIDKIEYRIFKSGMAPKIIYLMVIVAINVLHAFMH